MFDYSKRVCIVYCTFILAMSVLCIRIYSLLSESDNKALSVLEGQYSGKLEIAEHTGFVYDRNMKLISHNKSSAILVVNPAECSDFMKMAEKTAPLCQVASLPDIFSSLTGGVPFCVTLKSECYEKAKEFCKTADGIYYVDVYDEKYDSAKHFLGYRNIDGKGIGGLRGSCDDKLSGVMKAKLTAHFDTNAKRKSLSRFDINIENYNRADGIITTLDKDIQDFCDSLCDEIQSGAVMVTDIQSGEVLALSSYPSFDAQRIAEVLESDKGELLNRAEYSFTPGSVFKIVVALSALEKDLSLYDLEYTCKGEVDIDGDVFRCHNRNGHGTITLEDAFAFSCNTYFINLAKETGFESIVKTAKKLELDKVCSVDFLREKNHTFLDETSKKEGYLANISFGQGDLGLSVLDMTRIVIAASSGKLCDLSALKGEISGGFPVKYEEKQSKRIFEDSVCKKMLGMMEKCVNEGTGKQAGVEGAGVGGKTGTAQTGRKNVNNEELVNNKKQGRAHQRLNPAFFMLCSNQRIPAILLLRPSS